MFDLPLDSAAVAVRASFEQQYGTSGLHAMYRAPGRVNLIGEHTDYNQGFALPIAIDLACYIAAGPSGDNRVRAYSLNFDERDEWTTREILSLRPTGRWPDYFVGVAQQLAAANYPLTPLNVAINSTVPVGSGLSSSASFEVSTALALLNGRFIDGRDLALLCQRAEREFVGVPCGIMDQYVSVFGEANMAILIDCRGISHETVAMPSDVSILVVNSMVKHDLGESAYPTRVRECAEAVAAVQTLNPAVSSLRDVSSDLLDRARPTMDETVFRRAWHVVTENDRVIAFADAAREGDLQKMGRLFLASHRSLQKDYEVSCDELDFLVDVASNISGVYGSRMTGGGFGGCTVNLVMPERVAAVENDIAVAYRKQFSLEPQFYVCVPGPGAAKIC
jgi:galactokinase